MDADEVLDLKTQIAMLTHVTASLWANFLANSGPDAVETCKRVAEQSLGALDGIYERLGADGPNPGLHPTVQGVLHHEEAFWRMVEAQVRTHPQTQKR